MESEYYKNGKLNKEIYEEELEKLQAELLKLQYWVKEKKLKVCVIFEGRDAAGKGGVIKRITEPLNPRTVRIAALPKPTEKEQGQWYFQRYVNHAGVERVMGFCSEEEYWEFLKSCPNFEKMLIDSGIILIKYWFAISDKVQNKRFQDRNNDPLKRWKLSDMDLLARSKWVQYSKAKDVMFEHTDTPESPWHVVNADIKRHARLNCMTHLLNKIEYDDLTPDPIELPPLVKDAEYLRLPISTQNWIPAVYGENPIDNERS